MRSRGQKENREEVLEGKKAGGEEDKRQERREAQCMLERAAERPCEARVAILCECVYKPFCVPVEEEKPDDSKLETL